MKNIIYTRHDGGVSIVHLVPSEMLFGETEAAFIERVQAKIVPPDATNVVVADASAIPTDREFREAWVAPGGVISVDFDKAKAIAHDRRRAKRTDEFAPLDIKATIPSEAAAAEAARQVIRDKYAAVQLDIDDAVNVTELKNIVVAIDVDS